MPPKKDGEDVSVEGKGIANRIIGPCKPVSRRSFVLKCLLIIIITT